MQYLNEPVHKAAQSVVEALRREGGIGGVIALDDEGNGKDPTSMVGAISNERHSCDATELSRYVSRAGTTRRGFPDSYL
jgi:hypothetical protein